MQASGLCLVLLSTHQDAFHKLSEAAKRLQAELLNEGAFQVLIFLSERSECPSKCSAVHKAGKHPGHAVCSLWPIQACKRVAMSSMKAVSWPSSLAGLL